MFETILILGLLTASHAAEAAEPEKLPPLKGIGCEIFEATPEHDAAHGWVPVHKDWVRDHPELDPSKKWVAKCESTRPSTVTTTTTTSKIDWGAVADYSAVAVAGAMGAQFFTTVIGGPVAAAVGGWLFAGVADGQIGAGAGAYSPSAALVGDSAGVGAGLSAATGGSPALGAVLGVAALATGWEASK